MFSMNQIYVKKEPQNKGIWDKYIDTKEKLFIFCDKFRGITCEVKYGLFEDIDENLCGIEGKYSLRYDDSFEQPEDEQYTWELITEKTKVFEIFKTI